MANRPHPENAWPENALPASNQAQKISSPGSAKARWLVLAQALVIVIAGGSIYWPALSAGWMSGDMLEIVNNPLLHTAEGFEKIVFAPGNSPGYYPIEDALLWSQWHFWHLHTWGYRLCSLTFHLVNALLVWRMLGQLGLRLGWLGGLIFAIHPVMVQPVAWISELKYPLSLTPFLLATSSYLAYGKSRRLWDYGLAITLFLAAMLCHNNMAFFPAVILLHAWWKYGRVTRDDLKEAAPFLAISLLLGLAEQLAGTLYRNFHPENTLALGGVFSRLARVGLSFSLYLAKAIVPAPLEPVYPQWNFDPPSAAQFLPWPVLGATAWLLWKKRAGWGRHILFGLGFFTINLLPCLGFIAIPSMRATPVMNQFLYLPIIGLIGLAVAAADRLYRRLSPPLRIVTAGMAVAVLVLLAAQSRAYAKTFVDETKMWTDVLRLNPQSAPAHDQLGNLLLQHGDLAGALNQFQESVNLDPTDPGMKADLAMALVETGRTGEAIQEYEKALKLEPENGAVWLGTARALSAAGRLPEAIGHYRQAVKLDPGNAEAHHGLGEALTKIGQTKEGIDELAAALEIDPGDAVAHDHLGVALMLAGEMPEAMTQFEMAVRLNPNNAEALSNMGDALARQGRFPEAIEEYRAALKIDPGLAEAHDGLGGALQQTGQMEDAAEQYVEALKIKPDDAGMHLNMGMVLSGMGMFPEAEEEIRAALQLLPDNPVAQTTLGNVFLQDGKLREAMEQYREALKHNPHLAEAHNNLGAVFEREGELKQAADEYRAALRINPNDQEAQENLSRVEQKKSSPPSSPQK
ncbi:MAG TPA: tetratricopeptide repeat protein [Candidatus Methylacidiphilales bacterium]|nr:tetratricopeptide repeat protein [Candidatus Methylacidiphilales bacterium]